MSQLRPKYTLLSLVLVLGLLTSLIVGCGSPPEVTESEPAPDPAEVLDHARRDAADALKLFEAAGGNHRLQLAQDKVRQGLEAITEIERQADVTSDRLLELGQAKADLMFLGWQAGDEDYEQQLLDLAVEVGQSDPAGELAAYLYAKCFELRYLECEDSDAEQAIDALRVYANTFGPDDRVKSLFKAYGKQLQGERRWDLALACCEEAAVHFPNEPEIETERSRLEQYYARWRVVSYQKQRAYAALKAKLDNLEQGPFVIASWYDKSGSGMGKFKYVVLPDIHAVRAFETDLPAGAIWELMRAFPNTVDGRQRAGKTRARLLKRKLVSKDTNISKALNELRDIAWSN